VHHRTRNFELAVKAGRMSADERPPAANDLGRNTQQAMRQEADAVTKWLSIGVAAIAVLLIARAVWQDVVIDEADTALAWVLPPYPQHWSPNPNNHLLNSLLARVSIALFGLSPFTLRLQPY
jgi:hypothetical protein